MINENKEGKKLPTSVKIFIKVWIYGGAAFVIYKAIEALIPYITSLFT